MSVSPLELQRLAYLQSHVREVQRETNALASKVVSELGEGTFELSDGDTTYRAVIEYAEGGVYVSVEIVV